MEVSGAGGKKGEKKASGFWFFCISFFRVSVGMGWCRVGGNGGVSFFNNPSTGFLIRESGCLLLLLLSDSNHFILQMCVFIVMESVYLLFIFYSVMKREPELYSVASGVKGKEKV